MDKPQGYRTLRINNLAYIPNSDSVFFKKQGKWYFASQDKLGLDGREMIKEVSEINNRLDLMYIDPEGSKLILLGYTHHIPLNEDEEEEYDEMDYLPLKTAFMIYQFNRTGELQELTYRPNKSFRLTGRNIFDPTDERKLSEVSKSVFEGVTDPYDYDLIHQDLQKTVANQALAPLRMTSLQQLKTLISEKKITGFKIEDSIQNATKPNTIMTYYDADGYAYHVLAYYDKTNNTISEPR